MTAWVLKYIEKVKYEIYKKYDQRSIVNKLSMLFVRYISVN